MPSSAVAANYTKCCHRNACARGQAMTGEKPEGGIRAHCDICSTCGQAVDQRKLDDVLNHTKPGHEGMLSPFSDYPVALAASSNPPDIGASSGACVMISGGAIVAPRRTWWVAIVAPNARAAPAIAAVMYMAATLLFGLRNSVIFSDASTSA